MLEICSFTECLLNTHKALISQWLDISVNKPDKDHCLLLRIFKVHSLKLTGGNNFMEKLFSTVTNLEETDCSLHQMANINENQRK